MRGPGSIPTGCNILSLDFFHVVKPLMPILALLPISSNLCKTRIDSIFIGRLLLFRLLDYYYFRFSKVVPKCVPE